jgi:ELWxxDGT repeat protein
MLTQLVEILADVNTDPGQSTALSETDSLSNRGLHYFVASTILDGFELWVTDGTTDGTLQLTDAPGPSSSNAGDLVALGEFVYFIAADPSEDVALWRTDGTPEGTARFADVQGLHGSRPFDLAVFKGNLVFVAEGDSHQQVVYSTDGTPAGIRVLTEISTVLGDRRLTNLRVVGDTIILTAYNPTFTELSLWSTDGTGSGTVMLASIVDSLSAPSFSWFTQSADNLFMMLNRRGGDRELWVSDGTTAGTGPIHAGSAGPLVSQPWALTRGLGGLFFTARVAEGRDGLWFTDGTSAGTTVVEDENSHSQFYDGADVRGSFVFRLGLLQLWISDGTAAGTKRIALPGDQIRRFYDLVAVADDLYASGTDGAGQPRLVVSRDLGDSWTVVRDFPDLDSLNTLSVFDDNGVVFLADDGIHGAEYWFSDGTFQGTELLRDLNPGTANSSPSQIVPVGNKLVFQSTTYKLRTRRDEILELSATGAIRSVRDGPVDFLTSWRGMAWYVTQGSQEWNLWRWDGEHNTLVGRQEGRASRVRAVTLHQDKLFILTAQLPDLVSLFVVEGSASGTRLLGAFTDTLNSPNISLQSVGSELFIKSNSTDQVGFLLRRVDPASGNISEGSFVPRNARGLRQAGAPWVASTDAGVTGSGGGEIVTLEGDFQQLANIGLLPSGETLTDVTLLMAWQQSYYFVAPSQGTASTLWRFTPGTDGPVVVLVLPNSLITNLSATSDYLFVQSRDQDGRNEALWSSDGTAGGTTEVATFVDRPLYKSLLSGETTIGDKFVFLALDVKTGQRRIWISDGTTNGTFPLDHDSTGELVIDTAAELVQSADGIVFRAATVSSGSELFRIRTDVAAPELNTLEVVNANSGASLKWDEAQAAVQYDVWIQSQSDPSPSIIRRRVNRPMIQLPSDLNGQALRIWVRGVNVLGTTSRWSAGIEFVTGDRPVLHRTGRKLSDVFVSLSWTAPPDTVAQEVWISNQTTNTRVTYSKNLVSTQYTHPAPLAIGNYLAWVRSRRADGSFTDWSAVSKFQVVHAPVMITSPNSATVDATPTMTWNGVAAATSYEVYIAYEGSQAAVYRRSGIVGVTHRVAEPLTAGNYRFWVRANFGSLNSSLWGEGQRIEIGPAPVLSFLNAAFSWTAGQSATHYELWIDYKGGESTARTRILNERLLTSTSFSLPSQLPKGRYQAWVRALRAEAGDVYRGRWSQPVLFEIT